MAQRRGREAPGEKSRFKSTLEFASNHQGNGLLWWALTCLSPERFRWGHDSLTSHILIGVYDVPRIASGTRNPVVSTLPSWPCPGADRRWQEVAGDPMT